MSFLFVQVKRFHYRDLYSLLTADQKAAMPVLDPTQGKRYFVEARKEGMLGLASTETTYSLLGRGQSVTYE